MAESSSGGLHQFYGVIIRDKCKTASHATLQAYKTVVQDLLKDHQGPDTTDLKGALAEIDKALASKK
jgi:hypothetical protein